MMTMTMTTEMAMTTTGRERQKKKDERGEIHVRQGDDTADRDKLITILDKPTSGRESSESQSRPPRRSPRRVLHSNIGQVKAYR